MTKLKIPCNAVAFVRDGRKALFLRAEEPGRGLKGSRCREEKTRGTPPP
jgi:hypothetical protein